MPGKIEVIVSFCLYVTFEFLQSPGVYYQNNKGYIGSFYQLKIYMKKLFFYSKLFAIEQVRNILAMEDR